MGVHHGAEWLFTFVGMRTALASPSVTRPQPQPSAAGGSEDPAAWCTAREAGKILSLRRDQLRGRLRRRTPPFDRLADSKGNRGHLRKEVVLEVAAELDRKETEALDEATRERVKLLKKKRKFAALGRSQ
jgi:hypothetical protein